MNKNHNTNINNNATWKRNTNNDLHSIWHKLDKLHISGGSGSGGDACCPQTNEILNNIETNINSVIETCNDIIITSNTQIQRPTSVQNSDLFCSVLGEEEKMSACNCGILDINKPLDFIDQVNTSSANNGDILIDVLQSSLEPISGWSMDILDFSLTILTTFSGVGSITTQTYNVPLANTWYYIDLIINYVNGSYVKQRVAIKYRDLDNYCETRSNYLDLDSRGFDGCETIRLGGTVNLWSNNNPQITSNQLTFMNITDNTTPVVSNYDLYSEMNFFPGYSLQFNSIGTKILKVINEFYDVPSMSIFFEQDYTITSSPFIPLNIVTSFPNIGNSYDGNTGTVFSISNPILNEIYQCDWNIPLVLPVPLPNNINIEVVVSVTNFSGGNPNSGNMLAITDGINIYGVVEILGTGDVTLPIDLDVIPSSAFNNLKLFFAFTNISIDISEIFTRLSYNEEQIISHDVLPVSLPCNNLDNPLFVSVIESSTNDIPILREIYEMTNSNIGIANYESLSLLFYSTISTPLGGGSAYLNGVDITQILNMNGSFIFTDNTPSTENLSIYVSSEVKVLITRRFKN